MVTDKILIDSINGMLYREYRVLDGRPIYRIVWSDSQLEKRIGDFTDWYGHILIRQEHKALREVKKYWYFEKPCWVLEKLIFIRDSQALKEITLELVEARSGSYEPVYAFRDSDGNPLSVNWKVVEIILAVLHNPVKRLPSDFEADRLIEEQDEHKYFFDKISEDERPELFVWENSVFVSSRQQKFKQEYREKLDLIEVQNARVL